MQKLKDRLNIDETFSKVVTRKKLYNKVKDNVPQIKNYNYQADLLFMPTAKQGYKFILTCIDVGTDAFDIEPLMDKNPKTVLKGLQNMYQRGFIDIPLGSLRTDSGNEFKGPVHEFLVKENILHKVALPNRHRQNSNVENLNAQIGKLLNGYMNSLENKDGELNKEWANPKILDIIRNDLNLIKYKAYKSRMAIKSKNEKVHNVNARNEFNTDFPDEVKIIEKIKKPKYKIGMQMHRILDEPRSNLNEKVYNSGFRHGDLHWEVKPRLIDDIYEFDDEDVPFRYKLRGINTASFAEWELLPSKNKLDEEVGEEMIIRFNFLAKQFDKLAGMIKIMFRIYKWR
jgi:hypothetical protein